MKNYVKYDVLPQFLTYQSIPQELQSQQTNSSTTDRKQEIVDELLTVIHV